MRCPGQERRDLSVSYHPCPECGELVELFSDEAHVRCHACDADVYKEQTPTCVEWCRAARECLGDERYEAIMKELNAASKRRRKTKPAGDA